MSGVKIDTFTPWIQKTLNKLSDPRPFLEELGKLERSEVDLRFRFGEDPTGKPWKPSLRAERENGQTLVKLGDLRRSIDFAISGKKLFIGTNLSYAEQHQKGTNGQVQREFLGVNSKTKQNAKLVFAELFKK